MIVRGENFGRVREVEARLERHFIGFGDIGGAHRKLFINPFDGLFHRAVVQPIHQTERVEIFATLDLFVRQPGAFQCLHRV